MDSFSSEDPRDTETSTSASTSDVGFLSMPAVPTACIEEGTREEPPPLGLLPGLAHPVGGVLVEQPGWRDLGGERLALQQDAPVHSCVEPRSRSRKGQEEGDGDGVERPVQEVLDLLRSADPSQPQLRELEYQVLGFRDRLKVCPPCAGQQPHSAAGLRPGSRRRGQPAAHVSIPASPLCDLGGPSLSRPQFPHFSRPRRRIPRGGRSAQ